MDDVERALDDGINVYKSITKEQRFVPGAGASEIELARQITAFGETCPGTRGSTHRSSLLPFGFKIFIGSLFPSSPSFLSRSGLDQYAIKAFAEALEVVPMTLAENAGVKAKDLVSRLYAAHTNGQKNAGFNNEDPNEPVFDAAAAGIVDNLNCKHWALLYAAQAACTVLRVDQVGSGRW